MKNIHKSIEALTDAIEGNLTPPEVTIAAKKLISDVKKLLSEGKSLKDWSKVLSQKSKFEIDPSTSPDKDGSIWQRRLYVFNVIRTAYPGTKSGLIVEANRFFEKCRKLKVHDVDTELQKAIFGVVYQKKCRELDESMGEFVPPWKNMSTWLNNACWQDEMGRMTKQKYYDEHAPSEMKYQIEQYMKLLRQ